MDHNKVQKLSGSKYITNGSNTKSISITTFGWISIATHHIEYFLLLHQGIYDMRIGLIYGPPQVTIMCMIIIPLTCNACH